jgi:hypothetical protein
MENDYYNTPLGKLDFKIAKNIIRIIKPIINNLTEILSKIAYR